jgi:HAMP domain-containing protein
MRDLLQGAETALAEGGRAGLTEWLRGRNARLFGTPVFIVDEAGVELLGRPLPPRRRADPPRDAAPRSDADRVPMASTIASCSRPQRSPVFGVFSLPQTRGAMLLLAILAGALVSWALARSLTRPIADLQRAARGLAAGDLGTQVAPATRRRGDELGTTRRGVRFHGRRPQGTDRRSRAPCCATSRTNCDRRSPACDWPSASRSSRAAMSRHRLRAWRRRSRASTP